MRHAYRFILDVLTIVAIDARDFTTNISYPAGWGMPAALILCGTTRSGSTTRRLSDQFVILDEVEYACRMGTVLRRHKELSGIWRKWNSPLVSNRLVLPNISCQWKQRELVQTSTSPLRLLCRPLRSYHLRWSAFFGNHKHSRCIPTMMFVHKQVSQDDRSRMPTPRWVRIRKPTTTRKDL